MTQRGGSRQRTPILSFAAQLVVVALLLYLGALAIGLNTSKFSGYTPWFLYAQDRWLLLMQLGVLVAATCRLRPRQQPIVWSDRTCIIVATLIVPICYLGHWQVLNGIDLSRDEQMATFDAHIFARGLLVQPVPSAWRAHLDALNTMFILTAARPVGWVSTYLPVNAGLRALVGTVADAALTGPILTAVGAFASWRCARLIWPDDREAATLTIMLYVSSGQVLLTGMSAFAMSAHLALNMLWLWLFFIDRKGSDIAALAIGFFATGLHQPLFHPLFVAPFILLLIGRRAWGRAALFTLAYAAISLFWLSWPGWMYQLIEAGHPVIKPVTATFWTRLQWVLAPPEIPRGILMGANLLRFAAWQPILLLPLFVIGLVAARRNAIALALTAAVILPVIAAAIIVPDQGQGLGYRYLHGVIGAMILLAVHGWRNAVGRDARWRALVLRCLAGGLLVLVPAQLWMTYSYYASFAAVERRVAASGTDYVIIGNNDAPLSNALVINRADLTNRPLRIIADQADNALIDLICRNGATVGMPGSDLYAPINGYFRGGVTSFSSDRRIKVLGPQLTAAGCRVVPLHGGRAVAHG